MTSISNNINLSQEHRMLQSLVKNYVRDDILTIEQRLDPDAIALPNDDFIKLCLKTKKMGLWCMESPVKYGGAGLDLFSQIIIEEERVQHRAGLYLPVYGTMGTPIPDIIWQGSDYLKNTYGVPTVKGEKEGGWYAITEPSGGSDPARSIETKAVRDGDDWILNGSKIFITGSLQGEWGYVFARTNPKEKRGITCFIVENNWEGFSVTPIPVMRPYYPGHIFFDNVRVPNRNILGEPHGGWDILANKLLSRLRIPYAAANLGVAVAANRLAVNYSKYRETFGAPLSSRQAIQWMLVDSEVEIRSCRWLIWEAAWKFDSGEDYRQSAAIAKLYSSEVLSNVVDRAIQIHGGYGVTKSLPLERWYREARIRRLGEGPSEIQRMMIAREIINPHKGTNN